MFICKEARESVNDLPALLDYSLLLEDGIAFLRSGTFLAAWEVHGPDTDPMTPAESYHLSARIESALDLGADFGVGCDLIRASSREYAPENNNWPDPVSYVIDQERRAQFTTEGNYSCNVVFFVLTYRPVSNRRSKAQSWFFDDSADSDEFGERSLKRFKSGVDRFERALGANMCLVRRLGCYQENGEVYDDLHRYIRYCVLGQDHPFVVPDVPAFLNELITGNVVGGAEPSINGRYIATVAIDGFPRNSFANIFSALRSLPFEYRFCQQSEILDTQQAMDLHSRNSKQWGFKKVPFLQKLLKKDNTIRDTVAAGLEAEAQQAVLEAEYRKTIDVYYTAKVVITDSYAHELREKVRTVLEAVRPFTARLEDQNALAAWISSFPGQMYMDKRQSLVTTTNLSHFLPLGAPWRGHQHNPSQFFPPKTPPLMYAVTAGGTAYRFHAHTSDRGHVLLAGPIGTGKTTFLGLGIAQWFRYPQSPQVFAFDKKRTLYTLTKAMGGDYYD
jgi:type IV secretion system protein TrbE